MLVRFGGLVVYGKIGRRRPFRVRLNEFVLAWGPCPSAAALVTAYWFLLSSPCMKVGIG